MFVSWLNRLLNPNPTLDPEKVRAQLSKRCNAEIAARLVRRAFIHEEHGGYVARCSPLDREAAARITQLEQLLAVREDRDPLAFERQASAMLAELSERK
jgi:hypothetical protein